MGCVEAAFVSAFHRKLKETPQTAVKRRREEPAGRAVRTFLGANWPVGTSPGRTRGDVHVKKPTGTPYFDTPWCFLQMDSSSINPMNISKRSLISMLQQDIKISPNRSSRPKRPSHVGFTQCDKQLPYGDGLYNP